MTKRKGSMSRITNLGSLAKKTKSSQNIAPDVVLLDGTETLEEYATHAQMFWSESCNDITSEHDTRPFDWGSDLETDEEIEMENTRSQDQAEVMELGLGVDMAQGSTLQGFLEEEHAVKDLLEWHDIKYRLPPSFTEANAALTDIKNILQPHQKTGDGYKDAHP
ncbi:hypothetical protein BDN71DRAFT_1514104 [Pleurotus eryngii]|uniref:Uncharacterized protein n=1 Tax=Pleurotus eryngii TaxID=5323 RepID=A0A9P6D079_PLEER|nr:hypothetical protein BDN71DRAFT_1514104 [Pleurotus eryngii]